jgi:hypothetical protein
VCVFHTTAPGCGSASAILCMVAIVSTTAMAIRRQLTLQYIRLFNHALVSITMSRAACGIRKPIPRRYHILDFEAREIVTHCFSLYYCLAISCVLTSSMPSKIRESRIQSSGRSVLYFSNILVGFFTPLTCGVFVITELVDITKPVP